MKVTLRLRMSAHDAHYGGNLVDGARILGLFGDVAATQRDVQSLSAILPGGAITVISDQIANVAAASDGGLSLAAVGGFLLSLWSANGATKAMIAGIGVAYDQPDKRGFVRKTLVSLAFTAGFLAFALVAVGVMALQVTIGERVSGAAA